MATLEKLKKGLDRAWEGLAEDWQGLREKASQALTRFRSGDDADTEGAGVTSLALLAAEVQDRDREIVVSLEVPGMEREDFDLEVLGSWLVVRGEKRSSREHRDGGHYVKERAYGRFERTIPLPAEVDRDKARAKYRRGILTVTLPKSAPARTRRIEVGAD